MRQSISREHSARTSGRRNFTAGGTETLSVPRAAGDSVWETEDPTIFNHGLPAFVQELRLGRHGSERILD